MNVKASILFICCTALFLSCGGQQENSIQISFPEKLYTVMDSSLSRQKYDLHIKIRDSHLGLESCLGRPLYVCGSYPLEDIEHIVSLSLKEAGRPFFSSIHQFAVHPNLIEGHVILTQEITVRPDGIEPFSLEREFQRLGRKTAEDSLLEICLKALPENSPALILLPRSATEIPSDLKTIRLKKR